MLQHGSVVVLASLHGEARSGVRLAALVARNHLDLAVVTVLALGNVQVPHAVVDQLVTAAL